MNGNGNAIENGKGNPIEKGNVIENGNGKAIENGNAIANESRTETERDVNE